MGSSDILITAGLLTAVVILALRLCGGIAYHRGWKAGWRDRERFPD